MAAPVSSAPAATRIDAERVDDVAAALRELAREHAHDGRDHAMARTLNLVVAPLRDEAPAAVLEALDGLDGAAPARTIVLAEHASDRIGAELALTCAVPGGPRAATACAERVTLTVSRARLEHADSLLASLLVRDLPTVAWLPGADPGPADAALTRIATRIVIDSAHGRAPAALARARALATAAPVHDLAWARLGWWRARVAAAFEPPPQRALLPRIDALELDASGRSRAGALLLAGWVAARLGWTLTADEHDPGALAFAARRPAGGDARISIAAPAAGVHGVGGVTAAVFRAGRESIALARGTAAGRGTEVLVDALTLGADRSQGYAVALGALADLPSA